MNLLSLDLQQWRIGGGEGFSRDATPLSVHFFSIFMQFSAKILPNIRLDPREILDPPLFGYLLRDKILEAANLVDLGSLVSLGLVWNTLLNSNELNCQKRINDEI